MHVREIRNVEREYEKKKGGRTRRESNPMVVTPGQTGQGCEVLACYRRDITTLHGQGATVGNRQVGSGFLQTAVGSPAVHL